MRAAPFSADHWSEAETLPPARACRLQDERLADQIAQYMGIVDIPAVLGRAASELGVRAPSVGGEPGAGHEVALIERVGP